MKELDQIEQIIIRSLDQTATDTELEQLNKWLNKSETNRTQYYQFKDVWETIPVAKTVTNANTEWSRFKKKNTPTISIKQIGIEISKIAAVALIALSIGFFVFKPKAEVIKYAKIEVPYGSKSSVMLPDGTSVILNAGSELTYPTNFDQNIRNVSLVGEGFFEVAHNADKPFVVSVDDIEVRVLGTKFNVMAYPEFKRIETTLVEGKVQLNRKGFDYDDGVILKPGQKATFADNKLKLQRANLDLETNWTKNEFYFENIPFEELMTRLEKWYDVTISYNKADFEDQTYTGKFRNEETVWQALNAIQMTTPVEYTTEHRKVFITLKK